MSHSIEPEAGDLGLRQYGAILLISCYELGHQPLGIAQPLGFLEAAGYKPAGLDIAVDALDNETIRQARFAGISVPMHTALRLGVRVAELIRECNQSCHICFYGLYAALNAEYLLQQVSDSVIGAEYEESLVTLVEALERGPLAEALEHSRSVQSRENDRHSMAGLDAVNVQGRPAVRFLGRLPAAVPVPSRQSLAPLARYAKLESNGGQRLVGYVEASRGCLHQCLHCPIVPVYEGRFVLVPQESVLGDIRRQVENGASHITFGDPDFLNGPGHSMRIVKAMHADFPHVTFDFTAKIEHILKRRSLFPELRDLGCLFVISAVESFSDTVLDRLKKGHTRADVTEALAIVREAGITLRPSLVAFTPWTTVDDYLEMFEIVAAHGLIDAIDPVQYTIRLLVPPGSALLQQSDIGRFLDTLDRSEFQYRWSHPDPRMDQLHQCVTATIQIATQEDKDPDILFHELRALAYNIADRCAPAIAMNSSHGGKRAPRLTEPWFCCAEPTQGQFRPLRTMGESQN